MKKAKKLVLYLILTTSAILVIGLLVVQSMFNSRMEQTFRVPKHPIDIPQGKDNIMEGQRLYVSRGCGDCHGADGFGVTFIDSPPLGHFSGSNLTKSKTILSGDGSLFERAVRHGVSPDGGPLVFMPSTDFSGMSDEDLSRILAYLRSLPTSSKGSQENTIGPLARILFLAGKMPVLLTAELIDHKKKSPVTVTSEVTTAYGKYIAQTCTGCHRDTLTGGPIPGGPPDWPPATNITSSGLSKYNLASFMIAIRTGKRPDGSEIQFPMPWKNFSHMTDTELMALYKYLGTL
jgi:mono/diheme cytochrome c family protein